VSVRELRNQVAEHDSGVVVRNVDRYTVGIDYLGRSLRLPVERGVGLYYFTLPDPLSWDDGTAVSQGELEQIKRAVSEVERFWGTTAQFD
jgi:hypothetical protein